MKKHPTPLLDGIEATVERIRQGTISKEEIIASFDQMVENKIAIEAELGTKTIAALKQMGFSYHAKTKSDWVDTVYRNYREAHIPRTTLSYQISFSQMCQTPEQAFKSQIARERDLILQTTPEMLAAYAAEIMERRGENKRRLDAAMESMKEPKTLADFDIVAKCREGGLAKLTPMESALYDQLRWTRGREMRRENEAAQSRIAAVDLEDIEIVLHQTVHTQKGHTLYVVVPSDWIEHQDFEELCSIAHRLSGYYSSYSGNGAIPGFTFREETNAKAFMEVFENDITDQDRRDERRRLAALSAKDRLIAIGERMIADANTDLEAPRKVNTARRIRQFESRIQCQNARKALARTLISVASMLGSNSHPLDGIRHRTHIELLASLLQRAKWRMPKEHALDVLIQTVRLPALFLNMCDISSVLRLLEEKSDTVMVRRHLVKRYQEAMREKEERVTFEDRIEREYAVKIFQKLGKHCPWYLAEALRQRRSLDRMQIYTSYDLRHALRAFGEHIVAPEEMPKRDKLIRGLVGRDIPGFFPTPPNLVDHLLDLAEIPEGATVIEPSAGIGSIADVIAERHPNANLICIERHGDLVEILKGGHDQVHLGDWLEQDLRADRIVMNPPFEDDQDIDHVRHAFACLKPGGRLVSIMSSGSIQRTIGKAPAFKAWLNDQGAMIIGNPEGSFLSAFRSTGVNTITVVIDRPHGDAPASCMSA
jgi:hypothetical protein